MTRIKKIQIEHEGKTIKSPVTGKTLYNESLEFQDKIKVRFIVGPFKGVVQDLPELKAKRMIKAKKAELADKSDVTPEHEVERISSRLTPKKNETGKTEKEDKRA